MSKSPADYLYADSHEWVKIDGDTATIGITHFAQDQLGDITYVDLPSIGDALKQGGEFGSVESVKAASDLFSPVAGEVIAINDALNDTPETVNTAPYTDGWMLKVKISGQPQGLLSATDYEKTATA